MQSRRQFLKTSILSGAAALVPGALTAQAKSAFTFEPDGQITIAGQPVPIDIALLGPNGEATAGFYASLDPFHGQPFGPGWGYVYDYLLKNGPHSTDPKDIENVITHVTIHGITRNDLEAVYQKARKAWNDNPKLRTNHGQGVDFGSVGHDDGAHHDHD